MVFWKTYPLLNLLETKINREIFKSQIFNKEELILPTGIDITFVTYDNPVYIDDIKEFIKNNFGEPPATPILDIPSEHLLGEKDHILVLRDSYKKIIGCVRYHYIGVFVTSKNKDIYCIDCFTVDKKWRKQGLGDYLLTTLHNYVNKNNMSYSVFLKEGSALSIIHNPLFSGVYVFRKLQDSTSSKKVKSLTIDQAYKVIDLFRELNNGMFIIRNIKSKNQFWKLYKNDIYKVLVCFQDAFQSFEEEGSIKKICWATGWFESSNMTDEYREEASRELSALMYPEFDYVWMNKEWIGCNNTEWKLDGQFHWYTYQWASNISIKKSYCILN